ncbi:hypothetical protein [Flaviflexus salsibiostraticola]|uniref:hypothetical protein n=1 Tax=Flaviflexus salsibiostraticola TaxID=1282737 RepID=UPI0013DDD808|nr:hypothetical protein [Flaviflexus salsibiostraticola]
MSLTQLAPQVSGMLTLSTFQFGAFSAGYLTFALASSFSLSAISEAYARSVTWSDTRSSPADYAAVSTWTAGFFGAVAGVIFGFMEGSLLTAVLGFLSVTLAGRRFPIRYLEIRLGSWRRLFTTELLALVLFSTVMFCVGDFSNQLDILLLAWTVAGIAHWVLGSMREVGGPLSVVRWFKHYWSAMSPLLKDSAMLDMSAVGTPYLLIPVLGAADFGIYRAISNFSAPVRMLINLLRPQLSRRDVREVFAMSVVGLVALLGMFCGIVGASILLYVEHHPLGIDVLDEVSAYWAPAGIFLAGSMVGHYLYVNARTRLIERDLIRGRLLQSGISIALPLLGALSGLSGAIWMFSIGTLLGSLVWLWICFRMVD